MVVHIVRARFVENCGVVPSVHSPMPAVGGCGTLEVMATAVFQRVSELRALVAEVAEWRDPIGVLSVTIGMEPGSRQGGNPPWVIVVENELARLRHEGSSHLRRCLDDVSDQLEEVLDPVAEARSRALYVALDSGRHRQLELQAALPTGARVGPVAHVLPLVQVLEDARPAGLVFTSKDQVVVLGSELAQVRELERIDLEPWVGDWWPEMKGPSRANPLRGQHAVSQRERYASRLAAAYAQTQRVACEALAARASAERWTMAVLAGDPRTVRALEHAVRGSGVEAIATLRANLEGLRGDEAVERLQEALGDLAADVSLRRARAVLEEAADGSRAARGLRNVLRALNEARVGSLVIDSGHAHEGAVGPDGTLRPPRRAATPVDLTDRIVARCLETRAEIHPVHGAAAEALADSGGIAARLRW